MDNILDKDKLIVSLRKQLQELHIKCSALEQENALLNDELNTLKKPLKKR